MFGDGTYLGFTDWLIGIDELISETDVPHLWILEAREVNSSYSFYWKIFKI